MTQEHREHRQAFDGIASALREGGGRSNNCPRYVRSEAIKFDHSDGINEPGNRSETASENDIVPFGTL